MKLLAAGTMAAVLLLAGCGSSIDGAAVAGSAAATTAAAPTLVESSEPELTEPSEPETSKPETSKPKPSKTPTSEPEESEPEESEPSEPETSEPAAQGLDGATTDWFTTFCDGLKPMQDFSSNPGELGTDLASIGAKLTGLGDGLAATATTLGTLPPPTFEGGGELASKVVAGLTQMATAFSTAGTQLAAGDPAAAQTMQDALLNNPMQDIATMNVPSDVTRGIEAIPSCAALGF